MENIIIDQEGQEQAKSQSLGMETFNPKIAELTVMKDQYAGLVVTDINDKAQLKAVHDARMTFVKTRTDIRKQGKLLREESVRFQKLVIEKEDELIGIIEPTEKKLEAEENRVEAERARIKLEKEQEEQRVLQDRLNRLAALDYKFSGQFTVTALQKLSEAEFDDMESEQKKLFNEANIARIEAEKIAAQEKEAERIRLEEKAKQEKIDREKMDKEREALAEEKRVFEAERQKVLAEQKKKDDEAKAIEFEKQRAELEKIEEASRVAKEELAKKEAETKRIADEKAAQDRALKQDKLKKFLIANGYTNETKDQFDLRWSDDKTQVALWKCVGSSFI